MVLPGEEVVTIETWEQLEQYNSGHIPGSLALGFENLRTNVNGLGSMLSPVELLGKQFSLLGIEPEDKIVLVSSEGIRDATLVGLALERAGHQLTLS